MKIRVAELWNPVKGVTIKKARVETFLFHFAHPLDMEAVLNGGPWIFDNSTLILEQVQLGMQIEHIPLFHVLIWVQVHNLPMGLMKEKVGRTLANYMGSFMEYDKNNNSSFWRQYMRIRVRMDVRQPLKKDTRMKNKEGEWCTVNFMYEKLGVFCFVSGIMGHAENKCEVRYAMEQDDGTREWTAYIRTRPRRQGGRIVSKWLREEKGGREVHGGGDRAAQTNSPTCSQSRGPTNAELAENDQEKIPTINQHTIMTRQGLSGPMKILSWNCRGLSTPSAIPNLRNIAQGHQPDILFLSETPAKAQTMERIREKDEGEWRLTCYYGYPEMGRRRQAWDLLRELRDMSDLPWCILGDFNDFLSQEDKRGNHSHPNWLCSGFRTAVSDCDLTDIHLEDYPYTWIKSREFPNDQQWDDLHIPFRKYVAEGGGCGDGWLGRERGTNIIRKTSRCAEKLSRWGRRKRKRFKQEVADCGEEMERLRGNHDLSNSGRYIEVIHALKRKTRGRKGELALKIDITKAYDKVDWGFLRGMLERLGFASKWIHWMMLCVSSVNYSVLVNFDKARGDLHGVKICRGALTMSHLLFADDCFLFCRANIDESTHLMQILHTYEEASGQEINLTKSEVFISRNLSTGAQEDLSRIMGVRHVLGTDNYLGLPSMIGRKRKDIFAYIKDRVWKRINSWRGRALSKTWKEVMIKSVLQVITSYVMSIYLLPDSTIKEIERIMNSFWWGGGALNQGIRWLAWDRMTYPKALGGMGFRDLHSFNLAMIAKQGWHMMTLLYPKFCPLFYHI
ncbi:hypothetical protein TSUD_316790 [Trifolium subterraneum]|uniref:Reverse transcriptase domain-containing protein n=1 Tax=Trifolium subterraneum TaxID=3900 RepID=A0A2Z6NI66_TRISU|nr:hypothetical protein TSUD_316790 [Trifolium subterraneum]